MAKIFGIPLIISVLLGILFPYVAISLKSYSFIFLFLLMIWAGLTIDWGKLPDVAKRPGDILIGLFFLYFCFPIFQWILAKQLISDDQFLYGLLFTSLTPVAIVAPFFTKMTDGDEELSFLLLLSSMIISPILTPFLLKMLASSISPISSFLLFKDMILYITLPMLISYLVAKYAPKFKEVVTPHLALLNMVCLSILFYILFGTAVGRLNLSYHSSLEISKLLLLVFIQDFGVLFISRFLFPMFFNPRVANAFIITLAMKNVAIAAGILLFYDPRASFPATLAFVAHAFLFSFIPLKKNMFVEKQKKREIHTDN